MERFSWKENLIALIVAVVFVGAFALIINNADSLKADILSQNPSSVDPTQGDVLYTIDSHQLQIISNKFITNPQSLTLQLVADPEMVQFLMSGIQSSYEYTYAQGNPGNITVILTKLSSLKPDSEIINIPFSGDQGRVVLGQVTVGFEDGTVDTLSLRKK